MEGLASLSRSSQGFFIIIITTRFYHYHHHKLLSSSSSQGFITITATTSIITAMTMIMTNRSGAGDYMCTASNGVGRLQHATITLSVLCECISIITIIIFFAMILLTLPNKQTLKVAVPLSSIMILHNHHHRHRHYHHDAVQTHPPWKLLPIKYKLEEKRFA